MFTATVLLDSLNEYGDRLTTFWLHYPRFIHSEVMTHRLFSRNAASSRAIPVKRFLQQVMTDPAMPVWWGKNQSGMQAREELAPKERDQAIEEWMVARDQAVASVYKLESLGVHKQITNRLLEPWMTMGLVLSSTTFANFFHLRHHPDAQPEMQHLAKLMYRGYQSSTPTQLLTGDWHLPFVDATERSLPIDIRRKLSVARCARVSYLNHTGAVDVVKDIALHDKLAESGHWSPFEHCAMATLPWENSGNFVGFEQYRKHFPREHVTTFVPPPSEDTNAAA